MNVRTFQIARAGCTILKQITDFVADITEFKFSWDFEKTFRFPFILRDRREKKKGFIMV